MSLKSCRLSVIVSDVFAASEYDFNSVFVGFCPLFHPEKPADYPTKTVVVGAGGHWNFRGLLRFLISPNLFLFLPNWRSSKRWDLGAPQNTFNSIPPRPR